MNIKRRRGVLGVFLILSLFSYALAPSLANTNTEYRMKNILEEIKHITSQNVNNVLHGFSDMENHWSRDSVGKLAYLDIIGGYPDGTFKPNQNIQVDEFIKLTVTALGFKPEAGEGYWAEPFIQIAKEENLIENNEFNNFRRPITREEMAKIIVNAVLGKEETPDERLTAFLRTIIKDYQSINDKHKHSVLISYGMGLISGYIDGTFKGGNNSTRGEASVVVMRFLDPRVRNKNIIDERDKIILRNNLTGEYETIYPPSINPEVIRIANVLKEGAKKSKGFAEPFYSGFSGSIFLNLHEIEEHAYSDDPKFTHGSIGVRTSEDIEEQKFPYRIMVRNINEAIRLHNDVIKDFLLVLFEGDGDKAIEEYEKQLSLTLADNNGFRHEVILNDRILSFFKDGANKQLSINIGRKGFRREMIN